ncbi:MAG: RNA polymerase sigma factor [Ruminococcaceae bacterium]|nr:RNA polymerase sigma factor [Oscillospiraceae bacterium]
MQDNNAWFEQVYRKNYAQLLKLSYYTLNDRHLCEDLVEDVFYILLKKQDELMPHPNIAGWLTITLKHLIYDELKSAKHRLELPLCFESDKAAYDAYEEPLSSILPEGLRPKEREIFILLYEEQLSYEEIACRLGITEANCRARAYRAKAHYRDLAADKT